MIIGKDSSPSLSLNLGGHEITSKCKEKHLGVPLTANSKELEDMIDDRIVRARGMFYTMLGIRQRNTSLPPLVTSKLYNTVISPGLLYGLELVELPHKSMDKLEKTRRYRAFRNKLQILSHELHSVVSGKQLSIQTSHLLVASASVTHDKYV